MSERPRPGPVIEQPGELPANQEKHDSSTTPKEKALKSLRDTEDSFDRELNELGVYSQIIASVRVYSRKFVHDVKGLETTLNRTNQEQLVRDFQKKYKEKDRHVIQLTKTAQNQLRKREGEVYMDTLEKVSSSIYSYWMARERRIAAEDLEDSDLNLINNKDQEDDSFSHFPVILKATKEVSPDWLLKVELEELD